MGFAKRANPTFRKSLFLRHLAASREQSDRAALSTLDEFSAPALATFDRLDTNHVGVISAAERQAQDSRPAAKKQ